MRIPDVDMEVLVQNWWAVALRGLAGVLFGLFTFFAPGISLGALVLLFGAYAFADGVFSVVAAIRRHGAGQRWGSLLVHGLLGIGAGVVTLFWPGITVLALLYIIAVWAIVAGAFEIVAAIRLRKAITGEWLLALTGVASVGLGVLLIVFPAASALALVLWVGAFALVSGVMLLLLGFRLRSWGRTARPRHAAEAMA